MQTNDRDPRPRRPEPEVSPHLALQDVATAMRQLSEHTLGDHGRPPLEELVQLALEQVPQARWASVTMLRAGRFTTAASSGGAAVRADALQYELGSGPCVNSAREGSLYVTPDAASDPRWVRWGRRAAEEAGVHSVLAQRLLLHHEADAVAALNLYSDRVDAFDEVSVGVVLVLATHAAAVVNELVAEGRAEHLERALESNREIGVAMGILMQQHLFTRDEAFDVLRVASQHANRKLADIAAEVADTGTLAIPTPRWTGRATSGEGPAGATDADAPEGAASAEA